jgi:uncharacterized protein YqeY
MLIEQIRAAQLEARKTRDTVAASLLTTLIGEATTVTEAEYAAALKDAPEGATVTVPITDEKVTATVTKFLKNAKQARDLYEQEFERVMGHGSRDDKTRLLTEEGRVFMEGIVPKMRRADREIQILESFLPKQMNEEELRAVIEHFKAANPGANVGAIMGHLKAEFAGLYDGKLASQIAKG